MIDHSFGTQIKTIYNTEQNLLTELAKADLVISAVLIPGAAAPKLITKEMLQHFKAGSVIVDVAIDQGGSCETSRPTNHEQPTFVVDEVVHYCVTNMPGAVAHTATIALTNATLPYILQIAASGYREAMKLNPHLKNGLNIHRGAVTNQAVAESLGYEYQPQI